MRVKFRCLGLGDLVAAWVTLLFVVGAALFGVGWGLVGFCPGPALAGLSFGLLPVMQFVATLLIGMAAYAYLMPTPGTPVQSA